MEKFQTEAQRPNVQNVYKLFENSKILYIEPAKYGRYKARIEYHAKFDLVILFDFNDTTNEINVITYYSETIKRRHK